MMARVNVVTGPKLRQCLRTQPHLAHRWISGRKLWQCQGTGIVAALVATGASQGKVVLDEEDVRAILPWVDLFGSPMKAKEAMGRIGDALRMLASERDRREDAIQRTTAKES